MIDCITKLALQTKYPSPLAGYYGYGMSNYGLPQVNADNKFPYFNFGQNESLHSAMGYNCKYKNLVFILIQLEA